MTLEPGESRIPPRTVEDVHAEYRQSEPWAQALHEHRPVAFDMSRAKLVGLAAICAGVAVLGAYWVRDESGFGVVMALLCAVAGAGGGARALRLLAFASASVRVDTFGVRVRPGNHEYPWHDILGAATWRQNRNHFVGLQLTDSARTERYAHRSLTYQRVRRILTWPHGDDVVVLPHPLAVDRERLAGWLQMEAVYRNPELRSQVEAELAQGVSPPQEQR